MQMEISGWKNAIIQEAKGYETLIMCYHYCHGYCYSWLSMQGWEEKVWHIMQSGDVMQ